MHTGDMKMKMPKKYKSMRRACPLLLTIPFCFASAMAQQAGADAEEIEEIIITGSRIPRAGFDTLQPALVIDAEFLEDRSFTDIGSALNEIPSLVRQVPIFKTDPTSRATPRSGRSSSTSLGSARSAR